MNQELIKFIELCLADGVISDKEREVILRKSRELGVPEDECEIIIDGLANQKVLGLKNNGNIPEVESPQKSVLSKDLIDEISNLDSDVLVQILNYIRGIENELDKVMNPKFVNEKFQQWYYDLPNHLVKHDSKFRSESGVYFDKKNISILQRWQSFSFPDKFIKVEINEQLNIPIDLIIGLEDNQDNTHTLFLKDGFTVVSYTTKSSFFGSEKRYWNIIYSKKIKDFNIFDYSKSNSQLFYPLRQFCWFGFHNAIQSLVDSFIALNISFEQSKYLNYLPKKSTLGDDVVVKLSNHIKIITNEAVKFTSTLKSQDLLPFGFNTDGHQGWHNDTNCFRSLDYILLTLKHISSLIQIRNELIVAVLKEDRGRILLITEHLDSLGLMMNFFEKNQLDKMDKTIEVLSNGFEKLCGVVSELTSSVDSFKNSLSSELNSINNGINNINETLNVINILTTIQTYQIYKINKSARVLMK